MDRQNVQYTLINDKRPDGRQFFLLSPRIAVFHLYDVSDQGFKDQQYWYKTLLKIVIIGQNEHKIVYQDYHSEFIHIPQAQLKLNHFINYGFLNGVAITQLSKDVDVPFIQPNSYGLQKMMQLAGPNVCHIKREIVQTQSSLNGELDTTFEVAMEAVKESSWEKPLGKFIFSLDKQSPKKNN